MAKVSFTKLGLKLNQEIKTIEWNEQIIEIKQYLSLEKKAELVTQVINASLDLNSNFFNPMKVSAYLSLYLINYYTNINLTEKQKEDFSKTYDLIYNSGLLEEIVEVIPKKEYEEVLSCVKESIESVYKYKNSILGILDVIKQDYSDTTFDLNTLQAVLADDNSFGFLKDLLPFMEDGLNK